ncbi:hypothetical protein DL93DRAFT_2229456 [Clavulina sp. PMI_390]|nr:hypothetical protein DL93DRAFT_2229456 [Clavulina sp. PMI_390]
MPTPSPLLPTSSQTADLPLLEHASPSFPQSFSPRDAKAEEEIGELPRFPTEFRSPTSPRLLERAQRRRSLLQGSAIHHTQFVNVDPNEERLEKRDGTPIIAATTSSSPTAAPPPLPPSPSSSSSKKWTPWVLRTPVIVLNIIILIVLAVVVEALLKVNKNAYGWGTTSLYTRFPQIHIVWTYIPGLAAFLLVWQWKEMDSYVKLLQPYIDMSATQVPADKSVLLNYSQQSPWFVWPTLLHNRHIIPFITNLLALLAIGISPLFSSFVYLQQPPANFSRPIGGIEVLEALGVQNISPFTNSDAAGAFMKTSSLFDVAPPPFIRFLPAAAWTSTRISMNNLTEPGTIKAHTVCIRTSVSCAAVSSTLSSSTGSTTSDTISGSGTNSNTNSTCSFTTSISQSPGATASIPFGIASASCSSSSSPYSSEVSPETSAVAFWVNSGGPAPLATICQPTIALQRADVLLNATTSALLVVDNQTPLLSGDLSGNIGAPFNGSAFNGLFWSSSAPSTTTAAQLNLNSTYFNLGQSLVNLFAKNDSSMSDSAAFQAVVSDAYAHYLGILAQDMYFQSLSGASTSGVFFPTTQRVFISGVVTHILTALLLVMALLTFIVLILYRTASRHLALTAEPSTLAAAIALAGASDVGQLLSGKDTEGEMRAMLADLSFAIDPTTGRLVVYESEHGYAEVPRDYDYRNVYPASPLHDPAQASGQQGKTRIWSPRSPGLVDTGAEANKF